MRIGSGSFGDIDRVTMLATSNLSLAGANGPVLSCLSSTLPDLLVLMFEEMGMPAGDLYVPTPGVQRSHISTFA